MKKNFQARTFTGIRRSRVPRRWSADVSVDGEQAEVTSTFDAPCGNPLPWTRGKRNPSPSPRLLPESPFELLFRKKDRRYVYPIVSFYIRRDVSGSIVETRTTEEGGGGGSPRGGDDRRDKIGRYCRRSGDTDARPARYHHYHRRGGIERHSKSCDYATKRTPESSIEVQHFGLPILSVSEPSPPDENDRVDDYL